ncbi:MAG: hypothetical protein NC821_03775 [Candidatus Omnitrophica bacterium]|nr:hypothetical protein [Candidatus Omnitrophota bacterium]
MSAIEIMALIVVLFSGIKIIVLLIKPELWINKMAKKLWAKTKFTIFISLMIAIISLVKKKIVTKNEIIKIRAERNKIENSITIGKFKKVCLVV